MPMPLVIDTDIGGDIDDALAMTLALASPEVELIGVTVVHGDVERRARMAARILGMAGRADIPIFRGVTGPQEATGAQALSVNLGEGLLDVRYDGPEATIHDLPAPDWLSEESRRRSFHLAAIGPLSNVAAAVQSDPGFAGRLRHLSVMGGLAFPERLGDAWHRYFARSGREPASIDYNTACDPEAALTVARSGVPMTWVTAEITFQTPLSGGGLERIGRAGDPLGSALLRLGRIWSDRVFHARQALPNLPSPVPANAVACLHDPLAVASIFSGNWLTLRPQGFRYDVSDNLFRLQPVDDGARDAVAAVSVAVDAPAFASFVVARLEAFLRHAAVPGA
jgi:purine nucleosidase